MGRGYDCSICQYSSSRRANLKRHYQLVHHHMMLDQDDNRSLNYKYYQKQLKDKKENVESSPVRWDEMWKYPQEIAKFQNTIANSKQTFDQISNLRWQVNSLQQQIASFQNYLSGLMSHNLLISKRSVQGLSGYICEKCNTFGLKAIFDLGCDMTMKSRHRCNESSDKRDYQIIPIPPNVQSIDLWAAQVMANHLKSNTYIWNQLISKEVSQGFTNFNKILPPDVTDELLGIPERYYLYSVQNVRVNWLDKVINNVGQETFLTEDDLIDFFIRAKSTYAIFEFTSREQVRRLLVALKAY